MQKKIYTYDTPLLSTRSSLGDNGKHSSSAHLEGKSYQSSGAKRGREEKKEMNDAENYYWIELNFFLSVLYLSLF